MITSNRFACFILVTSLCTAAISAQQPSAAPTPAASKIHLDVVVTPKSGPPVADLQQQDFTLLDNKSPRSVTSFQAFTGREAPIKVVLVIDAVNTGAERIGYERIQIDKFLRADGGHLAYPVALAVFTDKGISIAAELSSDGNALSDALDKQDIAIRAIGRSAAFYGAAERLHYSVAALHQLTASLAPQPGRKIVLWVSPGWPLLSRPRVELSSNQQQQIFSDCRELLHSAAPGGYHSLQRKSRRQHRIHPPRLVLQRLSQRRQQTEPGRCGESRASGARRPERWSRSRTQQRSHCTAPRMYLRCGPLLRDFL
jgi:VWFA-related protein